MLNRYARIRNFLAACDEIVEGKFASAEPHITAVLKSIAASGELTELFHAVTEGFDYPQAKRDCLRFPAAKNSAHGAAFLPSERGDILAFVFCLFVEFDAGTMKFNDFLLRYFYEDGSYTASYALFADRMMRPFRDIVRDCFPELERRFAQESERQTLGETMGRIAERTAVEREEIARRALPPEDAAAASAILGELAAAAGRQDAAEVRALLYGYRYLLRCLDAETENGKELTLLVQSL